MENILLVGLAIFLGASLNRLLTKLKLPQVVAYILLGLILGKSFLGLYQDSNLQTLTPLLNFTLGIIGFLIGGELKKEVFKKYGSSIYTILLSEGLLASFLVATITTLLTHKLYLGLILGAIASATDPASTVNVLWEYKSKGPLTTTLTSIVALDDGLALLLYALVASFSESFFTHQGFSFAGSIIMPIKEITLCVILGIGGAFILKKLIAIIKNEDFTIAASLGLVAIFTGLAMHFKLDIILVNMVLGISLVNIEAALSEKVFYYIRKISTPFYIFFFIVIGAALNIKFLFMGTVTIIIIGYLLSRSLGKIFGAMLGGVISGAGKEVRQYTGICLFTQGGVAIGLAMSISNNFSHLGPAAKEAGTIIIAIVASTTFVVQLIGPLLVKWGIIKADEAFRNVTEEDIIAEHKVGDFIQKDFAALKKNATLDKIMQTVKEKESYHFPVIDEKNELVGLISLGNLRAVFREEYLDTVILAEDVAEPVDVVLYEEQPLAEAMEIFTQRAIDFLPVVKEKKSKKVVGILEYHRLKEAINRKLLERQKL